MPIGMRRRGYRQLHVGGGPTIITTFTQSLGAELLTNADFSAWTADDPDSWTVAEIGTSIVTQVDSGGGAGTGAAQMYTGDTTTYPRISQTVAGSSGWYEWVYEMTALSASGRDYLMDINGNFVGPNAGVSGTRRSLAYLVTPNITSLARDRGSASGQYVVYDSASLKAVTLDTLYNSKADNTWTLLFTPPGTPKLGDICGIMYRSSGAANGWYACIQWNAAAAAYDCILYLLNSGVRSYNTFLAGSLTGINGIRVTTSGNSHDIYTTANSGTSWTQRGSTVTNATHASLIGARALYTSVYTPTEFTIPN